MPTLAVERDILFHNLGRSYTDEEFDELCFEFGVELDEITSDFEEAQKSSTVKLTKQQLSKLSHNIIYKIDVPANRYDLLCIEGLSRALKIFLGDIQAPTYKVLTDNDESDESESGGGGGMAVMNVKPSTSQIRPFIVCAILKNISFKQEERYNSFMDLQDQLHRNLCRQRTLVAIGTHDMDTLSGPFLYDARPPTDIQFLPLTHESTSFTAANLLHLYETDPSCKHLKPYVPIIKDSPVYPVVLDSKDVVMSLPPIINGSHSKITSQTKNVFIECTATDLTKANIVLDTMVSMFSEYCEEAPFTAYPVRVNYLDSSGDITNTYVTPQMYTRTEQARVDFVNSTIGINVSAQDMVHLCNKVQLGPATLITTTDTADDDESSGKEILQVTVPPTRSDILHPVDIAEDVGIAYGYNNIVKRVPKTSTVGGEQPLNHLGDLLREEIGRAGYMEVLTHGLCSIHDNFTALRRSVSDAVHLSNPANVEYQVVRTTLLPGLLKTLQHNKSASFTSGFKIFEISDVVLPDPTHVYTNTIVGAKNIRRVCAVYAGPTSGFEIIHGLVDRIMTLTEVRPVDVYVKSSGKSEEEQFRVSSREGWTYQIRPLEEENDKGDCRGESGTYFPGRSAEILLSKSGSDNDDDDDAVVIGTFGILHPNVLANFDILYPASSLELDLQPLL